MWFRCKQCGGNLNETKCLTCEESYILSGKKCQKNCEINENTHCKSCNNEDEKIDQYNTHCKECSIKNCEICENNICTKCLENFLIKNKNGTIISCYSKKPERIDIINNGRIKEGLIEIVNNGAIKTQLNNCIKYYFEGTGTAPSISYWWKGLNGDCHLSVYFNISNFLPTNVYYLQDNYYLYLYGSIRYDSYKGGYSEFSANTMFFIAGGADWGCNSISCFHSGFFGVYAQLERVNHNGKKFIGGIYNRGVENGYHYISLDGFNYTTILGNGTGNIGWTFSIYVGQYGSATVNTHYTFTISDLFLIRKKD